MQGGKAEDGIVVPPLPLGDGRFADNIVFFGRTLRKAGLKVVEIDGWILRRSDLA